MPSLIYRSPVSAPLLGPPPISTPTHAASSSSGPSPKTVPPPPPPPANAPKTAQLTQPQHRHPPSPPSPRRRTRLPTPSSSSTVVAADERIGDYRAVRAVLMNGAGMQLRKHSLVSISMHFHLVTYSSLRHEFKITHAPSAATTTYSRGRATRTTLTRRRRSTTATTQS